MSPHKMSSDNCILGDEDGSSYRRKTGRGLGKCAENSFEELQQKLDKGMGKRRKSGGDEGMGKRLKYDQ